jgi:hypothetical protein
MRKLLFYIKWGINRVLFKKRVPLSSSIILTDKCNLNCKHCIVSNLGYGKYSFESVKSDLKKLIEYKENKRNTSTYLYSLCRTRQKPYANFRRETRCSLKIAEIEIEKTF